MFVVETKTKLDKSNPDAKAVLIATTQFEGPENAAEFKAWAGKADGFVINGIVAQTGKAIDPETADNYAAWLYGATLKANQVGREAADIAAEVKDHKLTIQGKQTDLDSYTGDTLPLALNKIQGAIAFGLNIGTSNTAKFNSKVAKAIASGAIVVSPSGEFVTGPGTPPVATAAPAAPVTAPKKNGAPVKK
jgi:hypothetical protein